MEFHRHSSGVKQSAPGGSFSASTDPDIKSLRPSNHSNFQIQPRLEIDELWDRSSSANGKRSKRPDILDHAGQLKERTNPKFTGGLSEVSQAKLGDHVVAVKPFGVANIEGAERPSARYRRRSVSATADEGLESSCHSWVKRSVSAGSLPPSTDPDVKSHHDPTPRNRGRLGVDELRDGFLRSGKRSERLDALDCTGKLAGRSRRRGQGGFSDVTQAKLGDHVVAVKALRIPDTEDSERRLSKRLAREIYVWAALDHPNVLELLGFAFEDGRPCLISPWYDNGTLKEYLQKFPDANRRRLVREIAEGLRYLHEQTPPIIHGDVKPTSVLVTDEHVAKICDFETSRCVEELKTGFTTGSFQATIRYCAPETFRDGKRPTWCSDVFSFACVALGKRKYQSQLNARLSEHSRDDDG
ncbi:hypothetical protein FRC00_001294 [Tulasnella sp. 408]|nr:hypothetical protein FRC00_001294 [Tulasnella sp. 408]